MRSLVVDSTHVVKTGIHDVSIRRKFTDEEEVIQARRCVSATGGRAMGAPNGVCFGIQSVGKLSSAAPAFIIYIEL